jgi:hypothetical protein
MPANRAASTCNGILEEPVPDQAGNGAGNQREPGVTQSYGRSPPYVDAVVPEPGVFYPAKSQPNEECGNGNPKNHVAPQKGPCQEFMTSTNRRKEKQFRHWIE